MSDALLSRIAELRAKREETRRAWHATSADYYAAMQELLTAPTKPMADPLKRTVGGPQAPCLSGDYGWVCSGCTCWKRPGKVRG